jgi:8-oxo-dGTP diphosphatase
MKITDQGIDLQRFQVVPRTLIFLFDPDHRILLIKGSPQKERWPEIYNGVGGHVEPNEDILNAARRELYEETGIKDAVMYLCGQIMITASNKSGVALFIFRGLVDRTDLRSSNEGELRWIPFEKLNDFPLVDDLSVLLPLVAEHQKGDPIIVGKYTFDQSGNFEILIQ